MDALPHTAFGSHRSTRPVLAPALLAALVLGGCSSFGGDNVHKTDLACPKVGIVRDANSVTLFRPGPGRGPADVVARGLVADYSGNCTYDSTGVTVDVSLALVAERGPALVGTQVPLTYFVAVSTPDGTLVTKQEFATTVDFPASGPREDLQPHIPLPEKQDARGYQLLVGFQLSPDQLDYNRRTQTK